MNKKYKKKFNTTSKNTKLIKKSKISPKKSKIKKLPTTKKQTENGNTNNNRNKNETILPKYIT